MKITSVRCIIILLFFLVSCNSSYHNENEFHYVIHGHVENGDGIDISLCRPSIGMDARQTVTITNGEYEFSGTAVLPEAAIIRFEKDIVEPGSVSCIATVFIEEDTVEYDLDVVNRDFGNCFSNHQYKSGRNNLYFASSQNEYNQSSRTWIYSDPKKMDSMHRYVYPGVKTNMLKSYEELFYKHEHQAVSLYILENIVINSRSIFDPEYLTSEEKSKLQYLMDGIDPAFHTAKEYIYLKTQLTNLLNKDHTIEFKDFQLLDKNKKAQSLADQIRENKITLLYFWFSGCGPCRKFNKETAGYINDLKEKGIGIISISSDESMEYWKKSTQQDSITWVNLYAGNKAEVIAYYNIHRYPTTYVFDSDLNLLGTGISKAEDLKEFLQE